MLQITESNVTIMVQDMDKAISFYQSIGFNLKDRWENHYAMVTATGITLGLHPGGSAKGSGGISIGLMIEDIDAAKALLETNGIAYKVDDGKSGSYLHFKDPDETEIYFVKPKWR